MTPPDTKTRRNELRKALVANIIDAQATINRMQRVHPSFAEELHAKLDALALAIRLEPGAGDRDLCVFFNFPPSVKLPPAGEEEDEVRLPLAENDVPTRRFDAAGYARSLVQAAQAAQSAKRELSGAG